jgi:7-cyano-7-deazaguanine reductase
MQFVKSSATVFRVKESERIGPGKLLGRHGLRSQQERGRSKEVHNTGLIRLEALPNKFSNRAFTCNHVFSELTALCPVTRLPDFYVVYLSYEPNKKLIELKSLKLYFVTFRNVEILHEELANKILEDLVQAISPRWVSIELRVNNRGGIHTTIRRMWKKGKGDRSLAPIIRSPASP